MESALSSEWISLAIDIALIVGLFFLWLTWQRNSKRQQKLEQMLSETARQLEEATMHLSAATSMIEQLKQQEKRSAVPEQAEVAKPAVAQKPEPANTLPPQNSTQATMILRMQREGESAETIAERLDIPLAQVKLMLKLHAASGSSVS